jgi:protein-L-isoaspartate(D-aspartate) O-methyltransferase
MKTNTKLSTTGQSKALQRFANLVIDRAGILDDAIADTLVNAFSAVPRQFFIADHSRSRALDDVAVPIGFHQILQKPSLIARMLSLIQLRQGMKILEIGIGSGYCSALMAAAGAQVYGIESIGLLAQRTRHLLDNLNFPNILIRTGDGLKGWPEHAPFDAIVVSTAIPRCPAVLLQQLSTAGGRLVAPIGDQSEQTLTLCEVRGSEISVLQLEPVAQS